MYILMSSMLVSIVTLTTPRECSPINTSITCVTSDCGVCVCVGGGGEVRVYGCVYCLKFTQTIELCWKRLGIFSSVCAKHNYYTYYVLLYTHTCIYLCMYINKRVCGLTECMHKSLLNYAVPTHVCVK